MGMFDSILGRKQPAKPDLDNLFGLPSAAITLDASLGFHAVGSGAVAFRAPEGRAFADIQAEARLRRKAMNDGVTNQAATNQAETSERAGADA